MHNYLKKKYNKEKIVILGHSWGSVLGTLFVLKYPQEVLYYIGAGQVIDIVENEKIGYEKVRELIIKAGNKKDLDSLEKIGVYPEKNYEKPMIKKLQRIRILQGKYKVGMNFIHIVYMKKVVIMKYLFFIFLETEIFKPRIQ